MDVKQIRKLLENVCFNEKWMLRKVEYSKDDITIAEDGNNVYNYGIDFTGEVKALDPFFRICVTIKAAPGSEVHTEVWIPEEGWNGRMAFVGSGARGGFLFFNGMIAALKNHFAVIHTDIGTAEGIDAGVNNPAVWADFGWRATHNATVLGKEIIELVTEKEIKYSYFYGASTGGQQGISIAEKYPNDYDGIVAAAPGIGRMYLHVYFQWAYVVLVRPDGSFVFEQEDETNLSKIVREFFAKKGDGAPSDIFVSNPYLTEDEQKILFSIIEDSSKFSEEQLEALKKLYEGPINPITGERIFAGWPMGLTLDSGMLSTGIKGMGPYYLGEFVYPLRWALGINNCDYNPYAFDYDKDVDRLEVMVRDCNSDTADLSEYKALGHKLILLHGMCDTLVPACNTVTYYEKVMKKIGGYDEAIDFCRLFLVPGQDHGMRAMPDGVDFVGSIPEPGDDVKNKVGGMWNQQNIELLMNWVENGVAPEQLMCASFNVPKDPLSGLKYERPVFMYPYETVYIGGDETLPESYGKREYNRSLFKARADRYWK